jgi:hypothetical protein
VWCLPAVDETETEAELADLSEIIEAVCYVIAE